MKQAEGLEDLKKGKEMGLTFIKLFFLTCAGGSQRVSLSIFRTTVTYERHF